ncbi:MAG TPA: hypothetical protein VF472_07020 [Burkholderiaceae bacterium]
MATWFANVGEAELDPENSTGGTSTPSDSSASSASSSIKLAFAFRAKVRDGSEVTARVVAASVDDAWAKLERKGFSDIVMLDSEHSAIKIDDAESSRRLRMNARDEQALRRQRSVFVTTVWLFFRPSNLAVWVPLTLWLVWRGLTNDWHGDRVYLPAAILGAYLIWFTWACAPSVLYNQALEASAWSDWAVVERRMRMLQRWKKWFNIPFKEHEMLTRTAMAEAGQGRVAEALQRVARVEKLPGVAPEFFQSRLASVYGAAKDYASMVACHRKSYEIKPSDSCLIDWASGLALRLGKNDEAQALLDKVDTRKLAPIARAFYERCRGIIAVGRRDYPAAIRHLEQALVLIGEHVGSPLTKGVKADIDAYYGIALAHHGRGADAMKVFARCSAMLEARGEKEILAMCEAAKARARSEKAK